MQGAFDGAVTTTGAERWLGPGRRASGATDPAVTLQEFAEVVR